MRFYLPITISFSLLFGTTCADAGSPPIDMPVFQYEQQAKSHCLADAVVWVIRTQGIYNASAERWYGRTNNGVFACRADVEKAGFHASNAPR
jgi:hypothetical protein